MDEKKTILVVDDMSQIRTILRFNLEKDGYNVIDANNGERALEYASGENPPDLIILDIMMPKMDGYEVIRRLRESHVTKHIPVIFLTAKAQKKDVLKGIEAGANDYMLKPFKFVDLHRKINRLIDMYPHRALAAIMITDIVGFSKEMEKNEEHAYSKLLIHNEMIRKSISKNRGEEIKTIGDAFLVRFKSAVDAVKAAMNIQNKFLRYNKDKKDVDQILVRIGIHIGDILIEDNDVFGNGVNVASKIEPLAEPGGICISADAYNVVKKSIDIKVLSLGIKELKNIKDSPEIFKILID
jgi:CheY-like chemotaxis protein